MKYPLTLIATLLLLPLAALHAAQIQLKPGDPAPRRVVNEWTEPRLKPGDPAPKLIASEWIQGGPVTEFAKDKAYLIDFWATPCWPCVGNIPYLNELYLKFKDQGLVVIGLNVDGQFEGSDRTKVKPLITKLADKITYPVAVDNMNKSAGTMMDSWLNAAGETCIPCAFLIGKDGRIAWIGNPGEVTGNKMTYPVALDKKVEELLAGRFNVSMAASEFLAEQRFERRFHLKCVVESLLENGNLSGHALETAYELAVKANEGVFNNDEQRASHLAVLARATFMKGEKVKAVELQEKVIALMADSKADKTDKALYQSTLDNYRAGHLPVMSSQGTVITLHTGDLAPRLSVGEWIQGGPITGFAKDKAYLVEFWATWCGPCVDSIPHVNALHLKFKDKGLVVIGLNVEGKNQSNVRPFVKKMAEKMTYPVALDNISISSRGTMLETWMNAAGKNGIPCAFLVGKNNKITWIGHPAELSEQMIVQMLADESDIKKAATTTPRTVEQSNANCSLP